MSKTQEALRLLREKGITPYAAAKEAGIAPSTVYIAMRREEKKGTMKACPCCGTLVSPDRIKKKI